MTSTRMLDSLRSIEYLVVGGDPMAESDEEFKPIESSELSRVELNKPGEGHQRLLSTISATVSIC